MSHLVYRYERLFLPLPLQPRPLAVDDLAVLLGPLGHPSGREQRRKPR
jgi:hypothetical protein